MCTMQQGSASVNSGSHQTFDVVGFDSLGQPQVTVGESLDLQAAISRSLGFNTRPGRLIAAVVPSGSALSVKLGKFDSEPENSPVDAFNESDDSDSIEGSEGAGASKAAIKAELEARLEETNASLAELFDGSDDDDSDDADDEPAVRSAADLRKDIEDAMVGWEYTRLPALGLQFALLRHLDSVEGAILEGLVDCPEHIGMIAKSLERFCAQCIERQPPKRNRHDAESFDWDSEAFEDGRIGEIRDDELEEYLNHWLDVSLEREHPELFKDEAAEQATA